jgi:tRNA modification GTPase
MAPLDQDTIVAISTPPGRGGIGIVRLSGPRACDIVAPLLHLRHPLAAGRARFGEVLDIATDAVLDQCVATCFAAPHSYTGEDVVEIAMHGSPVLLDYVLRQCCANGARLAEPGEFTQRAFLAGRIDLTQAEAVADLIGSSTLEQARVAARQLGGALAQIVTPIKAGLVALIAALEAGIDFAEDDIDVLPAANIAERIAAIRAPLLALEQSFAYGRIVRDGFKLAIVGRPNAGKSSLFNRLVQRDRAIVTATPGTTRDLVTERVAIDGIPVDLIDTAGLRDSTDEAERLGIAKSHQAIADADVVLLVLDAPTLAAAAAIPAQDAAILAGHTPGALLLAYNKIDLLPSQLQTHDLVILSEQRSGESKDPEPLHAVSTPQAVQPLPIPPTWSLAPEALTSNLEPRTLHPIPTSALTGQGIPELRAAIVAAVAGPGAGLREAALLTNLRQHQAVAESLRALAAAQAAVAARIPHEMLLLDLYATLRALDALTGATTTEDVLRLIFSTFCIGK